FCHIKERRVEPTQVLLDKVPALRVERPLVVWIRVVVCFCVKSVLWNFRPPRSAPAHHSIKLPWCRDVAWQTAGHAYDCYWGRDAGGLLVWRRDRPGDGRTGFGLAGCHFYRLSGCLRDSLLLMLNKLKIEGETEL